MSAHRHRPQFAVVVRGYDRHQVDDYVTRLLEDLGEAEQRARAAEQPTGASGRALPQRPAPAAPDVATLLPDDAPTEELLSPAGGSPAGRSPPIVDSVVLLLLSLASALLLVYVVLT